jgi:cytochrome c-type biogenesis protein CcmH/NrfF
VRRAALLLLAVLLLVPAGGALAATPKTSLHDLEDEVMCDVCNVPLNVAENPRSYQQRREIQVLIDQGLTKDQIKSELKRRYGPSILAKPESKGFSLTIYLVPVAVVLAFVALLLALLPRWRRRRPGPLGAAGPDLSSTDARRLEEDLARYDV